MTGVIPHFMVEQGWNHTGLTQTIETETMHERKSLMAEMSDAVITYEPSILFYLALLAANAAVLIGGALVLFRNVQTHVLYLILAVGFGFVVLLAVTPMYGFDMRFHFDSAYVYSNELLGMEGTVETPSIADPDTTILSYYRRAGDDYNCYAHYHFDFVSSNYTDTYQGLRHFRASEAEQELVLVETYQNNIGEAYLYIPQALGFAIARLLGLGFYPMLQLGRMFTYGVFVLLVFLAIRQTPFGKRLFLIVALTPATLVQTVSISHDALILSVSFYATAKVLAMAYAQEAPKKRDWAVLLAVSMYLAPCKLAYVPVSFFWLLIVYRRYLQQSGQWQTLRTESILQSTQTFCDYGCMVSYGWKN